ncbi:nuclear transport factor 2 family protein [Kutzneria sp. CA-103260]|uniref:nuclear transport factor 2 family protein n=1 Tax=Kutzneria sp. CA-103260 TaxID=2802641 RepID=UPI001BA6F416|nr:nuclear transport factor 2 family protein [Kutzneria sp. CA-103260]QUQ62633.1 SnoaL-like domain protein [Kutzneria sp. CA-103260]
MTTSPDDHRLVAEVFARYLRAADHRDPKAMAAVFWPDATVHVYYSGAGRDELLGEMSGAGAIGDAVATGMVPHPELGWSHHTMVNPITAVDGDTAEYDAQFLVYSVRGLARPENGWPAGTVGAQGSITPIESGYVRAALRRQDGEWRIQRHVIKHDLPYVFPEA